MGGLPLRPLGLRARVGLVLGAWFHLGTRLGRLAVVLRVRVLVATRAARVRPPRALAGVGGGGPAALHPAYLAVRVAPRPSGLHRARGQPGARVRLDASRLGGGGRARRCHAAVGRQLPRRLPIRRRAPERVASLDASQQRLPRRQRLSRWRLPRQRRQHLPKRWRLSKQRRQHLPKRWRLPRWRSLPRRRLPRFWPPLSAIPCSPRLQTLLRPQTLLQRARDVGRERSPRDARASPDSVDSLFRRSGSRLTPRRLRATGPRIVGR